MNSQGLSEKEATLRTKSCERQKLCEVAERSRVSSRKKLLIIVKACERQREGKERTKINRTINYDYT